MLFARALSVPGLLVIGFVPSLPIAVIAHWVRSGLMRLGVSLAGAMRGYLRHSPLTVEDGVLTLSPTPEARVFVGEEVVKRLTQAARLMAMEGRVVTGS